MPSVSLIVGKSGVLLLNKEVLFGDAKNPIFLPTSYLFFWWVPTFAQRFHRHQNFPFLYLAHSQSGPHEAPGNGKISKDERHVSHQDLDILYMSYMYCLPLGFGSARNLYFNLLLSSNAHGRVLGEFSPLRRLNTTYPHFSQSPNNKIKFASTNTHPGETMSLLELLTRYKWEVTDLFRWA